MIWSRRLRGCLLLALPLVIAGPACNKNKGGQSSTSTPSNASNAPAKLNLKHRGAPHSARIDLVALSPDGKSALSRDESGGVRLWPSLDGKSEPIPLPARGVKQFSVAKRSDGAWTVALVEASGQGQFLRVDAQGEVKPLAALPPHDPLAEVHVLPDGQRVVTLHRDFTVRLLQESGRELGRFERRKFSPIQLRVAADGKRVVAIVLEGQQGESQAGYLMPMDIVGDKFAAKAPEKFRTPLRISVNNAVLSPDGSTFVFLAPDRSGATYRVLVHNLNRPGSRRTFPSEIRVGAQPSMGFASREALVLSDPSQGSAWQLDTRTGRTVPRVGPPSNLRGFAAAAGLQVGGFGTWLFVQAADKSSPRYLGYQSFHPSAVAISPSGELLAWGHDESEIFVEPFAGPMREPKKLESNSREAIRRLFFVGETHVLGIDSRNAIFVRDWAQDKLVAESSVQWRPRNIAYEPDSGVLLIDGGSQGKRVFRIASDGQLSDQFILPDSADRSGLFSKKVGGDAVLWTASRNDNKLRTYSLAELARGITADEVATRGDLLPPGELMAIDRVGNRYIFDRGRMSVGRGMQVKTMELQFGTIFPSWDGRRVLVSGNRSGSSSITAFDTQKLEELWTSHQDFRSLEPAWSPDGKYVAFASPGGGVVLDVTDGTPVGFRCGLDFEVRGAPPREAFETSGGRTVCEP